MRYEKFVDARGLEWAVKLTGGDSGSHRHHGDRDDRSARVWRARYRHEGMAPHEEYVVAITDPDISIDALRALLEADPEWQEDWAKAND